MDGGNYMENKNDAKGFVGLFFSSLLYNLVWLIIALVLLILAITSIIPMWPFYIALGVWILATILTFVFILWGRVGARGDSIQRENKNPYTKKYDNY